MNNNKYPKYYIMLLCGGLDDDGKEKDLSWSGEFLSYKKAEDHFERYRFDWQDVVEKQGMGIYVKKQKQSNYELVKKLCV